MSASTFTSGRREQPDDGQRLDVARVLAPLTRAMGLQRVACGAVLGFAGGAIVGAVILLVTRIYPLAFSVPAAFFAAALGAVAGALYGATRWPAIRDAARTADLYFGLDDRLTTAWELRSSDAPIAQMQNRDVARSIDSLPLLRSRGHWLRRNQAGVVAAAVALFAVALAVGPAGTAHHAALAAPPRTSQVRRAAAAQIRHLSSQLHLGLTPGQRQSPAMRHLDQALTRLRRQMLRPSTSRTELRAVSATQQQLRQLARSLHPLSAKAAGQLNRSLGRYLGQGHASARNGPSPRSILGTAQALGRLGRSLSHLTPDQRAALARALARSANTQSNSALRSSLRQAASSLGYNQTPSAQAALRQAAGTLSQSSSARAALSRITAAGEQLDGLKNQLSGIGSLTSNGIRPSGGLPGPKAGQKSGPGASTGRASSQGRGQRQGHGRQPGAARGSQTGRANQSGSGRGHGSSRRGRPGQGSGTGQGRAAGRGHTGATQPAQGTAANRGSGGSGRSSSTRHGQNVTVYIPAAQGKGKQIVVNGSNGAPETGNLVPYHRVLAQYAQSAHQALDRAALPPSLQGYVRDYFSSISR